MCRLSLAVAEQETMSDTGDLELAPPPTGAGSSGVPRPVRDELMPSYQGILRGKSMIDSESPEIKKQFADLARKKKGIKSRFTSMVTATKGDLKNEETNKKTQLHDTYIKSMLDAKLETTSREKAALDEIYAEMISIIDMYDCGPEGLSLIHI